MSWTPRRCWPSATPSRTSRARSRKGELIATFQDFKNFLPEKNRYMSLAEDLDAVRVWGCGEVPKKCGKVDFIQTDDERLKRYWLVLFDSPDTRAVLLCKQVNKAAQFADKKFIGFYSFNPYLVQSIRWRFNLLSCGLSKVISHWENPSPSRPEDVRPRAHAQSARRRVRSLTPKLAECRSAPQPPPSCSGMQSGGSSRPPANNHPRGHERALSRRLVTTTVVGPPEAAISRASRRGLPDALPA